MKRSAIRPTPGGSVKAKRAKRPTILVHGRYAKVQHRHVADLLTDLEAEREHVMDLAPEVQLLRALVIDYVDTYDSFVEALMAWYNDPEANQRPRRIMEISDASALIESISRVVHRMHQIQSEGAISLATFQRVTEHMGRIVAKYIKDPIVLEKIESEWMDLALDTKTPHVAPAPTDSGSTS